jgi:flagellar biosynthesis protein FlhG
MVSLFDDQAAGLRKLFSGARGPATVAFAGTGHAALVAGLARGLAAAGKEVLVIDEHAGADNVAAAFGLRSRFDLLQAVNRDVPASQVLLQPEPSIRLLPAARAARQCARLDAMARRALAEWLRRLQKGVDFVLVNTAERAEADFSPLLPQPQRIVIAVSPDGPSITEAYARMKRLAQSRDCRRFGVVLLAADAAEGRTVFDNLREVARRHLGAELELLGGVDGQSDPERIGHALAESFLNPPREAAGGFQVPARGLRGAASACPVALVPASGSRV